LGRHHADDGETLVVQRDRLTKNLRRPIEDALPNSVADDCDRWSAGFVFFFAKDTADFRGDADDIKEIARDRRSGDALRIAARTASTLGEVKTAPVTAAVSIPSPT